MGVRHFPPRFLPDYYTEADWALLRCFFFLSLATLFYHASFGVSSGHGDLITEPIFDTNLESLSL